MLVFFLLILAYRLDGEPIRDVCSLSDLWTETCGGLFTSVTSFLSPSAESERLLDLSEDEGLDCDTDSLVNSLTSFSSSTTSCC